MVEMGGARFVRCRHNGPLWEGAPAKAGGGETKRLAAVSGIVSPSVSFADSAPLLALRATSPVSGESVSQREPFALHTLVRPYPGAEESAAIVLAAKRSPLRTPKR